MPTEPKPPKVFVSYSWSSPEHEMRVLNWAERLRGDGVDVVLDKWDLREGQDKYAFMEQMVTNPEITKAVVFSDIAYARKADERKGGVGTESQIISKEVYEKVDQKKFIPVVCELGPDRKPCLPTFLASRIYVDFSSPEMVNEEWEKLLRAIFDRPFFKKPPLGKPPSHILEDEGVASRSKGKLLAFRDALLNDKSSFRGLMADFLAAFLESYEDYRIDFSKPDTVLDEAIVASIDRFLPARDEFVEFLLLLASYRTEQDLYDQIADFFESAIRYNWRPQEMTNYNEAWFENFQFCTYELLLYYMAALLKHRRHQQANAFLSRSFLLPPNASASRNGVASFAVFRTGMRSLAQRKQRLNLNRLDITAYLVKQRATLKSIPFEAVLQADIVLFVASMLNGSDVWPWYPRTLVFNQYGGACELFARATSKRGFEAVKVLFGVAGPEEFTEKLKAGVERYRVSRWSDLNFHSEVSFDALLNLEALGKVP